MRFVWRAIICWIAGLAIALLIAIAASLTVKPRTTTASYVIPGKPDWTVEGTVVVKVAPGPLRTDLWLDPGPYSVAQRRSGYSGRDEPVAPSWIRSVALDHAGPRFAGWMARVAAYGWPCPVLYWLWDWRDEAVEGGLDMSKKVVKTGPPSKPAEPEAAVPWQILWSGLAVNTTIFAAALWLPLSAFLAWRTLRRDARGWCRGCAYDLRGLTVGGACPECGIQMRDRKLGARAYRWINRGLVCLALAQFSTLLVAWLGPLALAHLDTRTAIASEVWHETPQFSGRYRSSRNALCDSVALQLMSRPWNESALNRPPPPPAWALALAEWGLRHDDSTFGSWNQVTTVSTGWPFRSFAGSSYQPRFRVTVPTRTAAGRAVAPLAPATPPPAPSGKRVGLLQFQALSIPWHPLPVGLALNVLVHAAAWTLAWLGFVFVRRSLAARSDRIAGAPPSA